MSLRARVVALMGLVLVMSLAVGLGLAGVEARRALHEELAAALSGGRQTVASSFEDLPRSDHPDRDLHQLVATFDGNRHLAAAWIGPEGRARTASRADAPRPPAPAWFARLAGAPPPAAVIAVPANVTSGGRIVLTPNARLDLAALWAEFAVAGGVLMGAVALGLVAGYWAIGQALRPLSDLSRGFRQVGGGDYRARVHERGPPELIRLERGFNDMAADLAAAAERNRALEAQLATIQEEERAELARDLHDEIGPHLFAVNIDAQLVERLAERGETAAIPEHARSIRAAVTHMQALVREILTRLRPVQTAELGLNQALVDLAETWRRRSPEVAFELTLPPAEAPLGEAGRDAAYRVAQEAIANALRHSRPTKVSVSLGLEDAALVLQADNDGAPPAAPSTGGLGLIGMRERVEAAGGRLDVAAGDGRWRVTARLPAAPQDAAA